MYTYTHTHIIILLQMSWTAMQEKHAFHKKAPSFCLSQRRVKWIKTLQFAPMCKGSLPWPGGGTAVPCTRPRGLAVTVIMVIMWKTARPHRESGDGQLCSLGHGICLEGPVESCRGSPFLPVFLLVIVV